MIWVGHPAQKFVGYPIADLDDGRQSFNLIAERRDHRGLPARGRIRPRSPRRSDVARRPRLLTVGSTDYLTTTSARIHGWIKQR